MGCVGVSDGCVEVRDGSVEMYVFSELDYRLNIHTSPNVPHTYKKLPVFVNKFVRADMSARTSARTKKVAIRFYTLTKFF